MKILWKLFAYIENRERSFSSLLSPTHTIARTKIFYSFTCWLLLIVQVEKGKKKSEKLISAQIWSDCSILVSPSKLREVQMWNSLEIWVQSEVKAAEFHKFTIGNEAKPSYGLTEVS